MLRSDADIETAALDGLNIVGLTNGILGDLAALREGRISVQDARARAELAKQALRAVGYVIQAQKFLAAQAKELPALGAAE